MDSAHLACLPARSRSFAPAFAKPASAGEGRSAKAGRSTSMLRSGAPSWRWGVWSQIINQAQDVGEQASRDCDLGKLERDIATVAHDFGADLDQP